MALLEQFEKQPTIVFNASLEATHQLFLLLRSFYGDQNSRVAEYSSMQPQNVRRYIWSIIYVFDQVPILKNCQLHKITHLFAHVDYQQRFSEHNVYI